jgi:26S proteasome regulatory subunit N11
MLRHGRAGVPMEVMGLMLGEFVDDYTVRVVDVFAMPQSGNGVSVEAVDPVFQTKMMDMLRQTGRYVAILSHSSTQIQRDNNDAPPSDRTQSLVGITLIPGLAAGSPRLISTLSNHSNASRLARWP